MNNGHIPFYYISNNLLLDPEDAFHFIRVMRGKEGDPLEVSDGKGRRWSVWAGKLLKKEVRLEISRELEPESPPRISIASAVPKGQRASYLIEKSVEMGISDLFFIGMKYSSVKDLTPGMLRRFEAVARSAAMQARHAWIPRLHPLMPLEKFLEDRPHTAVLEKEGTRDAWNRLSSFEDWCLMIGPEGGWAPEEIALFKQKDLPLLPLTDHPLRMETAAVAGLAFYNFAIQRIS